MKHVKKVTLVLALLVLMTGFATYSVTADAAKKSSKKVKYTLKKGTLTISGKGKMPSTMTFKGNNKIKKVVIKKGVTSIADDAFMNCRKLKQVTIPSSVKTVGSYSFCNTGIKSLELPSKVKTIGQNAFMNCNKLKTLTVPGNFTYAEDKRDKGEITYNLTSHTELNTVTFNTKLELKNTAYFNTNNFVVKANDPVYKSIGGVIYSKNGTSIVRVPFLRKELVIENGCTEFCLQSVLYCTKDAEELNENACLSLEKITIPASVKTVNYEKYFALYQWDYGFKNVDLVIQTNQLDGTSIALLMQGFDLKAKELQKKLPDQITYKDSMYVTKDNLLLEYDGKETSIKVPDGIKEIGPGVFADKEDLKTVELPDSLEAIGEAAFYYCEDLTSVNLPKNLKYIGAAAFAYTKLNKAELPAGLEELGEGAFLDTYIKEINIPKGITTIPAMAFYYTEIKKIDIPDTVTKIGEGAFYGCRNLREIKIGKKVKEIEDMAFMYAECTELKIPANVKQIGEYAFANYVEEKGFQREITILGSSKKIAATAFTSANAEDTLLIYKKGPKEFMTSLQSLKNKKVSNEERKVTCTWHKVQGASGYQISYCSDKIFKNKIKTVTLKKNQISYKINLKTKSKKIYVRIRPYKTVKGKKVYGRWTDSVGFYW